MSELISKNDNCATIRWKLLTGASALALTAYISSATMAKAEDIDRPTVWIELGGQLEQMSGLSAPFTAPFMTAITPTPGPYSDDIFDKGQEPPRYALGFSGDITFQPEDSDWLFTAAIRYGRSHANKHIHHQSPSPLKYNPYGHTAFAKYGAAFADTKAAYDEKHEVLDFQAGKDVGLGLFGRDGTATLSAGVRFADFTSRSTVDIHGRPTVELVKTNYGISRTRFHGYTLTAHAARSFKGIGPSLSWNASAALAGNRQDGELTLDWGIQGALLFGKQKAKTDHQSESYYKPPRYSYLSYHGTQTVHPPHHSTRSKSATVPNIGAVVGLSMKYPNVKFSLGYRYDTFLKAMDTGIDARKTSNLTFNGPYASISIGIGD